MKRLLHTLVWVLLMAAASQGQAATAAADSATPQVRPCPMHAMAPAIGAATVLPGEGDEGGTTCHTGAHCHGCHAVAIIASAAPPALAAAGGGSPGLLVRYTSVTLSLDAPPPRNLPL